MPATSSRLTYISRYLYFGTVHAFDVLGDPVRRRILELLADGERAAGAVAEVIRAEFGISQPAVSQHLKVLRENGFAVVRQDGTRRLYAVGHAPAARRRRLARPVPPVLDPAAGRAGHRNRPRQARAAPHRRRRSVIDVSHQISAVRRTLGDRVLEGKEARVLTISQVYDTDVDDLWDACTNPERIPRWFLPVSGELKLGGKYQLQGNAGGTVERCDPPKSFAATWEFGGNVSWIEVRLTPEGEGTRFELEHVAHVDERWDEFGPGAVGIGWDGALVGLVLHLRAPGTAVDPEAAMAWMMSADGIRFMTASGEAWYEADVAAGADPAKARAAADRTLKAYTTPPEA